ADAGADGHVFTLTYRLVPVAAGEPNFAGKVVSRVIQGTAADIFNSAIVRVARALSAEALPADVTFLLYDELWVEADPAAVPRVVEVVRREMERAAQALGVLVPVRIESETDYREEEGAVRPTPSADGVVSDPEAAAGEPSCLAEEEPGLETADPAP